MFRPSIISNFRTFYKKNSETSNFSNTNQPPSPLPKTTPTPGSYLLQFVAFALSCNTCNMQNPANKVLLNVKWLSHFQISGYLPQDSYFFKKPVQPGKGSINGYNFKFYVTGRIILKYFMGTLTGSE